MAFAAVLSWTVYASAFGVAAQEAGSDESRWKFGGVPAINFDSDEGLGYGVVVELYRYGEGNEYDPYVLTLQPTVLFSTEARRDFTVFFDTPYLLPGGWCLTAFVGSEHHTATPYYGIGNDSDYDEELEREDGPDPHFYRFGRTWNRFTFDLQRPLGDTSLRIFFGGGSGRTSIDPTPHDEGTTFLAVELAGSGGKPPQGWTNFLRGGLVWDTRDREVSTRKGVWSEFLVKSAAKTLGGDYSFTRWTVTDRRYFPLGERIVLANRPHIDAMRPNISESLGTRGTTGTQGRSRTCIM